MRIVPVGDTALRIEIGDRIDESTHRKVRGALQALETGDPVPGVREYVPAYTTVMALYDPAAAVAAGAPAGDIVGWLSEKLSARVKGAKAPKAAGKTIEIPVCFAEEFAPDLKRVAANVKLSEKEVVRRLIKAEFLVYLVGFAPGFPYLGGLPKELVMPRMTSPRTVVVPGSVGIAGEQCGIYPLATPGGWNLIGRTPLRLFLPHQDPPVLLQAGDRVKFREINEHEFQQLETS
jgi:inhibitor of KinA